MHEDQVGVRRVAEFSPSEAAHGDQGHPRGELAVGSRCCDRALRHLEGAHERRLGDIRQAAHDGAVVDEPEDIAGGDTEQFAAPQGPQRAHGGVGILMSRHRRSRLCDKRIEAARHELAIIGEQGDSVGRAQEQIGGEAARRQDGGHALGGERLIAQEAEVPRRGAEVIAHAAEAQQRGIRVGTVREPSQEDREERPLDRGAARHP